MPSQANRVSGEVSSDAIEILLIEVKNSYVRVIFVAVDDDEISLLVEVRWFLNRSASVIPLPFIFFERSDPFTGQPGKRDPPAFRGKETVYIS